MTTCFYKTVELSTFFYQFRYITMFVGWSCVFYKLSRNEILLSTIWCIGIRHN